MQGYNLIPIGLFLGLLLGLAPLLGSYFYTVLNLPMTRLESLIYQVSHTPTHSMNWKQYLKSLLFFQAVGLIFLLIVLLLNSRSPISWDLAFNTAVSFLTNTNWQAYAGENTLDYWVQMLGLTVQNFFSAATSIAVLLVLIRGLTGKETGDLGNFWMDLTRTTLFILIPGSFLLALFLVSQGAIQNFSPYLYAPGLLPMGPAASQTAISVLGSNGGGFFGQNAAHPFVNPTYLSNFVLALSILALPAGFVYFFGLQIKAPKQAWTLLSVMLGLFILFLAGITYSELSFGSLEGQELRFSQIGTLLFNTASTASSNGSINAALESLSPLAGGLMMLQIMLGEIIFGGVGSGLYGMLLFVMLTVFLAGLMVGRTPEYLGKKIEAAEINWILVGILIPGIAALIGAGSFALYPKSGAHNLSELLYAFTSCANNNGSAFGGLNANTVPFNISLGVTMLVGRFGLMIPVLIIAGQLGRKKQIPVNIGTFQTDTLIFAVLLAVSILLVGALTFLPGWFLGPLLEHVKLIGGGA